MRSFARILLPLGHSPGAASVLDVASAIARGMGSAITLLHVHEPPNELIGMVPGATVDGEIAAERAAGVALLDRAEQVLRQSGITAIDRIVERASPSAHAIVSQARRGGFDLIVMGTHGRKGVSRIVLGSIAEDVLRDAPCPVLTVHLPRGPAD